MQFSTSCRSPKLYNIDKDNRQYFETLECLNRQPAGMISAYLYETGENMEYTANFWEINFSVTRKRHWCPIILREGYKTDDCGSIAVMAADFAPWLCFNRIYGYYSAEGWMARQKGRQILVRFRVEYCNALCLMIFLSCTFKTPRRISKAALGDSSHLGLSGKGKTNEIFSIKKVSQILNKTPII